MRNHKTLVAIAVLSALTFAAGCTKTDTVTNEPTQVVARVNADEITVHQINNILERHQNIAPESATQVKRKILDRLVDQQLAQQKAIEQKLDRSPKVVQAIEAAKSEILARAYLERIAAALPQPQLWEIQQYYAEHPELFAERRVYDIVDFAFEAKANVGSLIRGQLSEGRSMSEIANWLRSRGTNFSANHGVRAAEQISLELLPKVKAMRDDQIQLLENGSGQYQLIHLVSSTLVPLDEEAATPAIQQFLLNRRTNEIIIKEMKQIKDQASIVYVGEFADDTPDQEVDGATETENEQIAK